MNDCPWLEYVDQKLLEIQKHGKITLFLSGGVDSQFLAYRLLCLGVEFECIFVDYYPDLDTVEKKSLKLFLHNKNLKLTIRNMFLDEFCKKELPILQHKYSIVYPFTAIVLKMLNFGGDVCLFGGGFPKYYRYNQDIFESIKVERYRQVNNTISSQSSKLGKYVCHDFYADRKLRYRLHHEPTFIIWKNFLSYSVPVFEQYKMNLYHRYFFHPQVEKIEPFGHMKDFMYSESRKYKLKSDEPVVLTGRMQH